MKKRTTAFILLPVILLPLLCGCSAGSREYSSSFFAFDTYISITVYSKTDAASLLLQCREAVTDTEKTLSAYNTDSELFALNSTGIAEHPSPELYETLTAAVGFCRMTEGAYDPSLFSVVDLWGICSDREFSVPSVDAIAAAGEMSGIDKILLTDDGSIVLCGGVKLDLGGIGKGYAQEKAARILENSDIEYAVLDFGGNITAVGSKADGSMFRIGIKNPSGDGVCGIIETASGMYISVSGSYERFRVSDGVTYVHIIDPDTFSPAVSDILSVAVISEDGMLSDAVSTALYVMGLEKGMEYCSGYSDSFQAVFVTTDGIYTTEAISDSFTKTE